MSFGAGKSGKPCARLIAPYFTASRVISRMTDSVKRLAFSEICCLTVCMRRSGGGGIRGRAGKLAPGWGGAPAPVALLLHRRPRGGRPDEPARPLILDQGRRHGRAQEECDEERESRRQGRKGPPGGRQGPARDPGR